MARDSEWRQVWSVGDRVRVDIPDETDSRHHEFHGRHGTIIATIPDTETPTDAAPLQDEDFDSDGMVERFRVAFDDDGTGDFTATDLRPPITV